jgi:hypothetical protein
MRILIIRDAKVKNFLLFYTVLLGAPAMACPLFGINDAGLNKVNQTGREGGYEA